MEESMKKIISILIVSFGMASIAGCSAPKAAGLRVDTRAGSEVSPYRTVPTAIQCDECRMPAER
jgi:hypothetical protein